MVSAKKRRLIYRHGARSLVYSAPTRRVALAHALLKPSEPALPACAVQCSSSAQACFCCPRDRTALVGGNFARAAASEPRGAPHESGSSSFGPGVGPGTLAVQLALPLAGCAGGLAPPNRPATTADQTTPGTALRARPGGLKRPLRKIRRGFELANEALNTLRLLFQQILVGNCLERNLRFECLEN